MGRVPRLALGDPALEDGLGEVGRGARGKDDVDDEGVHGAVVGVFEGGGEVAKGEVEPAIALAGPGGVRGGGAVEVEMGDPGAEDGMNSLEIELGDDLLAPSGFGHDSGFGSKDQDLGRGRARAEGVARRGPAGPGLGPGLDGSMREKRRKGEAGEG